MRLVTPYAKLIDPCLPQDGERLLRRIEWCGRISHRSEDAQGPDSWRRFIQAVVLGHGDWSIVEHASATADMLVDRGITHEIVRHRLASYTQESTRFVNYEKKMPPSFCAPQFPARNGGEIVNEDAQAIWERHIAATETAYQHLVRAGVAPQLARSVLPNALAARIVMTCNLRNWRHFFLMRTTAESHPQMRQVTIPLLAQFQERIPLLFDDIEPGARQSDNLKKPR